MGTSLSPPLLVTLFLLLLILLFALSSPSPSATTVSSSLSSNDDSIMSVWEQLELNVLPRGLLPASVTSYALDEDTRRFEVTLPWSCEVAHYDHLVRYETIVTGTLDFGSIKDLEGVRAKKFFLWYDVTAIEADVGKEVVEFQIGALTQTYPESNYRDVPSCKNGMVVDASLS